MAARPNFLFLMTDQQRADHLGCAGHSVLRTPHLDALTASGVHCRRAYVTNPLCMPSRSTLYTGLTPRGHGVRTNGIDLDPGIPTFTEALRRAGYRTHSVGKIHLRVYGLPTRASEEDVDPADFPRPATCGVVDELPTCRPLTMGWRRRTSPAVMAVVSTVTICSGCGPSTPVRRNCCTHPPGSQHGPAPSRLGRWACRRTCTTTPGAPTARLHSSSRRLRTPATGVPLWPGARFPIHTIPTAPRAPGIAPTRSTTYRHLPAAPANWTIWRRTSGRCLPRGCRQAAGWRRRTSPTSSCGDHRPDLRNGRLCGLAGRAG